MDTWRRGGAVEVVDGGSSAWWCGRTRGSGGGSRAETETDGESVEVDMQSGNVTVIVRDIVYGSVVRLCGSAAVCGCASGYDIQSSSVFLDICKVAM